MVFILGWWVLLQMSAFQDNSERNIIIFIMLIEQLRFILAPLNIHFDPPILQNTLALLAKIQPNNIPSHQSHIFLYALAAISCENQRLPSVQNYHPVKTGLSIQNILQHVLQDQKPCFLQQIQLISASEKFAQASKLKNKIKQILRAYNIFKKYDQAFQELAEQVNTDLFVNKKHKYIFWILYLYAKNQNPSAKDIKQDQQQYILLSLLRYIFSCLIPYKDPSRVQNILQRHFQTSPLEPQEKYRQYSIKFAQIIKKQYERRYSKKGQFSINGFLFQSMHIIDRFLDDFANHYQSRYNNIENDLIDQITFIDLDKTLTPQGYKKEQSTPSINKPLNFQIDDSLDNQSSSKSQIQEMIKVDKFCKNNNENVQTCLHEQENNNFLDNLPQKQSQNLKNIDKQSIIQHPRDNNNSRLQLLQWINSKIRQSSFQDECIINKIFQNYTELSFQDYKKIYTKKLVTLLERCAGDCFDKNKRAQNIMQLFIHFISKVQITLNHETQHIFQKGQSFDAFLLITSAIWNYSYKSHYLDYSEYCHIFGISKVDGFIPINWFGYHLDLPDKLKKYLFDLQETILFSQLWKDNSALNLFSSKSQGSYRYWSIRKRLLLHVNAKISYICQGQLSQKDKSRIYTFFQELLEKKAELFCYNNIDIILSCCIYYCFGTNIQLSAIVKKSHRLDNQNLVAFDGQNRQISFLEYFQTIFLKKAEDLHANSPKKYSIFCTPKTITSERLSEKKLHSFELKKTLLTLGSSTGYKIIGSTNYRERLRDKCALEAGDFSVKGSGFDFLN